MKRKDASVNVAGLHPEVSDAIPFIEAARLEALKRMVGQEMVVTSGKDGEHKAGSLHYEGLAVDLRDRDFAQVWASILEAELGEGWDIVIEPTHIHVERDPKKKPLDPTPTSGSGGATG